MGRIPVPLSSIVRGAASALPLCAALALANCATDLTDTGDAGLRVLAGPLASDTVDAYPQQLLVLELRDERGVPQEGVEIVFASDLTEGPAYVTSVYDVRETDEDGRATTRIRFGTVAGDAWLAIGVPSEGLTARVHFAVQPGRPVQLHAPAQALALGDTIVPTVFGLDRHGNASSLPLTVSAPTGPLLVTEDERVYATSYGVGTVRVQMLAHVDTAEITVVPQGWVAGYAVLGRDTFPPGIHTLTLDERQGAPAVAGAGSTEPNGMDWSPEGLFLAFGDVPQNRVVLVSSTDGSTHDLAGLAEFTRAHSPRFAADGTLYFWGRNATGEGIFQATVWESGTPVLVAPDAPQDAHVSADGARLTYAENSAIVVRDVASGNVTATGVPGTLPRFSPSGRHLAFVDASGDLGIHVLGGGVRSIGVTGTIYTIDWSPLGAWLLVGSSQAVQLVEFTTGQVLTLPWYLTYPTFRFVDETAPAPE